MKSLSLFVLGFIPFLIGRLLNWRMFADMNSMPPLFVIGLITLAVWFIISYSFFNPTKSLKRTVLLFNLPATLVLILVGIQELILHAYWMNYVGKWTQLFYLPLLNIGFRLTWFSHTVFPAYCASFTLMIAASFLGCYLHKKLCKASASYNADMLCIF